MKYYIYILLGIVIIMQFIRVEIKNTKTDPNLTLHPPANIEKILKNSCYDCHSNHTDIPFYAYVAPFSWTIASHVNAGREVLNFSLWQKIPKKRKIKILKRILTTTYVGIMPLPSYTWIHRSAKLNQKEKKEIEVYFKKLLTEIASE